MSQPHTFRGYIVWHLVGCHNEVDLALVTVMEEIRT